MLRLWYMLALLQWAACAAKNKAPSEPVPMATNWKSVDHSFPSFPDVDSSFPEGFERIPFSDSCNEAVLGRPTIKLNEGESRQVFEAAKELMGRFSDVPLPVRDVREAVASGLQIVTRLNVPLDGSLVGPPRSKPLHRNFVAFDLWGGSQKDTCRRKDTGELIEFAWILMEWTVVGPEATKRWPQEGTYIFTFGRRLDKVSGGVFFAGVIASAF